ncbi:ankyrin repeat domain-containing protein [Aestuariicoccus sp. MJ-SS9]|uniref:ankyrin repeat domain-containing protein n=1 Tax=Aestuariicoccus sp. MJ-SS9 TaxID=3079855 RepID=UPI00290E0BC6|nr:ankyrin repeat domain-containing protein [Aestuariicoccus sp. MJ-SS9]MDU8914081.1 ankyrin repeat domain-containing protein [Aestuariicoccus sp. MJ-SS9]
MRTFMAVWLVGILLSAPAAAGALSDAARKGDVAEIARLLEAGADVNEPGSLALPLHFAAMAGHAEAVALLAAQGARLDAPSSLGTPLHAAANFGHVEAVDALIAAGADPDVRDRDGYPPLLRAIANNRVGAVTALIAGGADVNSVTTAIIRGEVRGLTIALHEASFLGHDEIVSVLRAAGAGPIPPDVPADLGALGDPMRGRELAVANCRGCHTISPEDEPTKDHYSFGRAIPLIGVVGRPVAGLPDFEYSAGLIEYSGTWTPERLYAYALSPTLTVPGTRMQWTSDHKPEMIAHIVAYFVSEAE